MAMYDWNGNGKKDMGDNFIEYNIYKQSTKNSTGSSYSSSGDGSTLSAIIAVIVVFAIIGGIVNLCTPKCTISDCNSERTEGSTRCYYHKSSTAYKLYSNHSSSSSTGASSYTQRK